MDRKVFLYSVIASIIATIVFLYGIQPLSFAVWHVTTSTSNSVFTWYQNQQVRNAALGKRDWVSPMLMGFLAAFVSAFATSYFTNPILRRFIRSRVPDDQDHRHPIALARRLYLASILPVFVAAIIFDLLTLSAFSDLQMNASFSQRLDALAPYIDAQTEKQFRSRWAMMGTLRDYRAISADMDQLGAKAGITLPKVLYR